MSGKWIKARLGDIGEITKGSGISRDESNSGSLAAVRYGELYTHHDEYVKRYVSRISEDVARGAKLTKKGDVVFAGSGETPDDIGKCAALLDDGVYAGGDLVVFSPPTAESPIYWGCLLNMPYVQRQKASFAHGSSIYHLRPGEVARIEVAYANNVDTQRHIAEVLSTCDEVIEKSERAAEKYRQIKAGMLKDLLTRGIDNRGKMRPPPSVAPELYKDSELGPIPREWEVKRIDQIGEVVPGGTPSTACNEYWGGNIPFVTPIELGEELRRSVWQTARCITELALKTTTVRMIPKGSVMVSTRAPIGYVKLAGLDSITNQGCKSVVLKSGQLPLFHYYNFLMYINEMRRYGVGTTFSEISKSDFQRILMKIPPLAEQRAIAERLAAVDERIAAEVKTAEKYRKVKAGLMEKLLMPPVDAKIEDLTQEVAG